MVNIWPLGILTYFVNQGFFFYLNIFFWIARIPGSRWTNTTIQAHTDSPCTLTLHWLHYFKVNLQGESFLVNVCEIRRLTLSGIESGSSTCQSMELAFRPWWPKVNQYVNKKGPTGNVCKIQEFLLVKNLWGQAKFFWPPIFFSYHLRSEMLTSFMDVGQGSANSYGTSGTGWGAPVFGRLLLVATGALCWSSLKASVV